MMTRREFLNNLYHRLGNLSREQAEQHLSYYAEMLADRMEEGMSEEEAVASMEDVDTIAQRILQDEGVPPVYPDPVPSERKSGAEEQRRQAPVRKERNWRKPVQIGLWALAITAAAVRLLTLGSGGGDRSASEVIDEAAPVPEYMSESGWPAVAEEIGSLEMDADGFDIDGFHVGSDGIWYSEGEDAFYMGPDGIRYSGSDGHFYMGPDGIRVEEKDGTELAEDLAEGPLYEVPADSVSFLGVDWSSGWVELQSWNGDTIQFQEEGDGSATLSQSFSDGALVISGGNSDSQLKLLVPDSRELTLQISGTADVWASDVELGTLCIGTTSGDVACSSLNADDLTVYTTSGDVVLSDIGVEYTLEVNTSSGDIVLSGVRSSDMTISATSGCITGTGSAVNWNVSTSSGDISLFPSQSDYLNVTATSGQVHLEPARNTSTISVDTSSGDVELRAPGQDFYLRFDTSSGSLDRGGIPLASDSSGEYWRGNGGGCSVSVYTTSGDLTLIGE